MTLVHCLENGVTAIRPTDDGDIVVGVCRAGRRHSDRRTPPEGLERQHDYPTTISGRPGFSTEGGWQALGRAEQVPVQVDGALGHVRRPTVLGAIVAKAHAYVVASPHTRCILRRDSSGALLLGGPRLGFVVQICATRVDIRQTSV